MADLQAEQKIMSLDQDVWQRDILITPEIVTIERVEELIAEHRLSEEQKLAIRVATARHAMTIIEVAPGSRKTAQDIVRVSLKLD